MKPFVSIIIINYNTLGYLEGCINSLKKQTYTSCEIILIDNNSPDGSGDYAEKHFSGITTVKNSENIGYAAAGNQGIRISNGEYVMVLNPDILLEPDYVEKCVAEMEKNSRLASICGKIYKYNFAEGKKTDYIDTVGLFCFRNRRVIDDGQGLRDRGQFDQPKEIFGVSGACPIYRRQALQDAEVLGEYMDEDFFMYKEDVDLAWRLLLLGWKHYYLPSAVAYHGRGTGVLKRFSHFEVLKNRKKLSYFQKYHSFKNQSMMQWKNETLSTFIPDLVPILIKEILKFANVLFLEPGLWKAVFVSMSLLPRMIKKRRIIMKKKRASAIEMRKWLSGKQSQYLKYELENPSNQPA